MYICYGSEVTEIGRYSEISQKDHVSFNGRVITIQTENFMAKLSLSTDGGYKVDYNEGDYRLTDWFIEYVYGIGIVTPEHLPMLYNCGQKLSRFSDLCDKQVYEFMNTSPPKVALRSCTAVLPADCAN